MLIVLAQEHKEHLRFLAKVDSGVLAEFCRLGMDFIRNGVKTRLYASAAKKLEVPAATVQHAVEAIMYLLLECSKLMISEMDFHDSFLTLGLPEEHNKLLLDTYTEHRDEVRRILDGLSVKLPDYKSLEWRLDVQVASRALKQQAEPIVTMKLSLGGHEPAVHALQTDPSTLQHMTSELEQALKEMRTPHYRRVTRGVRS